MKSMNAKKLSQLLKRVCRFGPKRRRERTAYRGFEGLEQ
jgi:hypothetical protein